MYALYSNFSAFNQCRTACGLSTIVLGDRSENTKNLWTSSLADTTGGVYWRGVHVSAAGLITYYCTANTTLMVVPLGTYE